VLEDNEVREPATGWGHLGTTDNTHSGAWHRGGGSCKLTEVNISQQLSLGPIQIGPKEIGGKEHRSGARMDAEILKQLTTRRCPWSNASAGRG
jgi:hypothetical protein